METVQSPHLESLEIPSLLSGIGKASRNTDMPVTVPMKTRHLSLQKMLASGGEVNHKINQTLFPNTDIWKIQTFLLVFSHFYYRVAARDGDNF